MAVSHVLVRTLALSAALASAAHASPYATTLVEYDPGLNPAAGFTNAAASLGEPTRVTSPNSPFGGATTPFQSPFGTDEIVSIGEGGSLTVAFDAPVRNDPANPFGLDLLIFGNAFYFDSSFPDGIAAGLFGSGGVVAVSADGISFVEVPGVPAVGNFPTLGFTDPSGPFTTTDGGPATGSIPSDFTKPVDPAFNPIGLSFADLVAGYDGSGGGVGIDIGLLGFSEIRFVRITNPIGSGTTPEIDGFADVAIPAPATAMPLLALAALTRRRRSA